MRRRRAGATGGGWWRFSRYEVANGWIRPTPEATLEHYDPWQDFSESRSHTVGQAPFAVQPPYQTLMKLIHELEYEPGKRRDPSWLTAQSLNRIATWCQDHGPLGVLLSRWESIALAPLPKKPGLFVHRRYLRGTGRSVQLIESTGDVGDRKASVVLHDLDGIVLKEEEPGQTWHRFFPAVNERERDSFEYPMPYSSEFCYRYAERVFDFCKAARFLTGATAHLGADPPLVSDPGLARQQALEAINLLRRPVTSVVDFDEEGDVKSSWEAPSLLATFAEMYVQDLLFGRPVLSCASCRVPFVSSAYQAKYCSLACRYRGQKRQLRQQTKEAKALHTAGKTARQIAAILGQRHEVVARWLRKT
jgi:hypothetical protein